MAAAQALIGLVSADLHLFAVAQGATAHGDPEQWTVHEGKLYLNYSAQVRRLWRQDIPGNLVKSEANWPGVLE